MIACIRWPLGHGGARPARRANDDARNRLEAASGLEHEAGSADAYLAFDAAVARWPENSVALVARGTVQYHQGDLRAAARDYARALALDASLVGARNNLAQTLVELQCPHRARQLLAPIELHTLQAPVREAVSDTLANAESATARADAPGCADVAD